MWTRIGLATARQQLRVGGVPLIRCIAVRRPAVALSGAILRRNFSVSRIRGVAATGQTKTKRKTATRKSTKTAAKPKSAAKSGAKKPKARKTKKVAAKKKTVPKKKKAKKVLTEEEKRKLLIRELKKTAQVGAEPKPKPNNRRAVYTSEIDGWTREKFTEKLKTFNDVSASELERLETIAKNNRLEHAAALKAWVLARTPAEIVAINNARRRLHRLKVYTPRKLPVLEDERNPKRPTTPFLLFATERLAASNGSIIETSKAAAVQWKALSASERQPYYDNYAVDVTRYIQEYKAVFGQEPGFKKPATP